MKPAHLIDGSLEQAGHLFKVAQLDTLASGQPCSSRQSLVASQQSGDEGVRFGLLYAFAAGMKAKDLELMTVGEKYTEISKMLTPWMNYLQRCNRTTRGQPPDTPTVD